jgi:hypothetical protein
MWSRTPNDGARLAPLAPEGAGARHKKQRLLIIASGEEKAKTALAPCPFWFSVGAQWEGGRHGRSGVPQAPSSPSPERSPALAAWS